MVSLPWANQSIRSVASMARVVRSADDSQPAPNLRFIVAFDIFYLIGLVSLTAILLTVLLSSKIKRYSTWLMVVASWFITSLANLFLVGQQTGRPPMTNVCLTQAMFIYALPVLSSFYFVAFMLQMYLSISLPLSSNSNISQKQMILLHTVPCASFFCILIEVLIAGVLQPDSIQRHPLGMYCHLAISAPAKITAGLTITALAILLCLEVAIAVILWRLWKFHEKSSPLRAQERLLIDVAARVVIFGFCAMIAIGVSALQSIPKFNVDDNKTTLIQAALPVVASLIFGTHRDILQAWIFWRREPPQSPIEKV